MNQKRTSATNLCVVRIGYMRLLMPSAAGLKVVELLRDAVSVDGVYDPENRGIDWEFEDDGNLELSYQITKESAVRRKPKELPSRPEPTAPLAIGREPLKLTRVAS